MKVDVDAFRVYKKRFPFCNQFRKCVNAPELLIELLSTVALFQFHWPHPCAQCLAWCSFCQKSHFAHRQQSNETNRIFNPSVWGHLPLNPKPKPKRSKIFCLSALFPSLSICVLPWVLNCQSGHYFGALHGHAGKVGSVGRMNSQTNMWLSPTGMEKNTSNRQVEAGFTYASRSTGSTAATG